MSVYFATAFHLFSELEHILKSIWATSESLLLDVAVNMDHF